MKTFILFILAAVASAQEQARVSNGEVAKHGYVPSYVYLQITTNSGTKYCGGVLNLARTKVITAASCVATPAATGTAAKATATHIKFAFGQTSSFKHNRIFEQNIYISGFVLRKTDLSTPSTVPIHDIAVITLDRAVPSSLLKSVSGANLDTDGDLDAYSSKNLIVCGFGDTGDSEWEHEKLLCTRIHVTSDDDCEAALGTAPDPPQFNYICAKGDSSVCSDIGAPVYLPTTTSTGSLLTKRHLTTAVGIVSFCQGGYIFITQLGATAIATFLDNPQ